MDRCILVCCAMNCEADLLIEKLKNPNTLVIGKYKYVSGKIGNNNVVVGVSGIGVSNMACMIGMANCTFDISCLVNYGLSGGYGNDIHRGDVVVGLECVNIGSYYDDPLNLITFYEDNDNDYKEYNGSSYLVNVAQNLVIDKHDTNYYYGRLGSGDCWNKKNTEALHEKYNIDCEDMESISVYKVGDNLDIPHISIRGISNNESLGEEYIQSIYQVIVKNLVDFISEYVSKIDVEQLSIGKKLVK